MSHEPSLPGAPSQILSTHLLTGAIFPVGSENRHHKFGILNSKNRNLRRFPAEFMCKQGLGKVA